MRLMKYYHNERLITLTLITLSGFYFTSVSTKIKLLFEFVWYNYNYKAIIWICLITAIPRWGCRRDKGWRLRDGQDHGGQRGGHDAAQDRRNQGNYLGILAFKKAVNWIILTSRKHFFTEVENSFYYES